MFEPTSHPREGKREKVIIRAGLETGPFLGKGRPRRKDKIRSHEKRDLMLHRESGPKKVPVPHQRNGPGGRKPPQAERTQHPKNGRHQGRGRTVLMSSRTETVGRGHEGHERDRGLTSR